MFFSGLFQRKSDAPVTTPAELADAIGLSYDTYTGKQISSQRAMRLTAVFSCVRVLAESVGMLPCNLYHLNGSLKQRATGERLHKLISTHPNGYMTPQEFWELVVTCLCLRGNFYAYKVKAFGEVAELLPVDPGCVVPKLNSSWEPVYQVTLRRHTAIRSAFRTISFVIRGCIDQPITLRENRSTTTARYSQPS